MSKKPSTPKQTSLFNYFAKSPKTSTPTGKSNDSPKSKKLPANEVDDSKSDKLNGSHKSSEKKTPDKKTSPQPSTSGLAKLKFDCPFEAYDLVWAKLEGYPWWPSIVCDHPTAGTYKKRKGKTQLVHVQFFDDPVSRSWIKLRDLKEYSGKFNSDVPLLKDGAWNMANDFAEEAMRMNKSERWKLIAELLPSDDEAPTGGDEDQEDESKNVVVETQVKESPIKRKLVQKSDATPKRRKIAESSGNDESEDDEYKPNKSESESSEENLSEIESEIEMDEVVEVDSGEDEKATAKKKNIKRNLNLNSSLNNFPSSESSKSSGDHQSFPHLKFDFLQPDMIRDKNGRKRTDPDYDATTLLVPRDFLKGRTPAHKQWWSFKMDHFDCILFFKVGKFYELFHMDAVIGVNELKLIFMKGDIAHAGFPERTYQSYADKLIKKGYRVARIEQTETPKMMEERCKRQFKNTKVDKVVTREVCAVTTIGTRTVSSFNSIEFEASEKGPWKSAENNYLIAVAEKEYAAKKVFGVCFVDSSIGKFYLGQFEDDDQYSRLRTVMAHYYPVEVLLDKKNCSEQTRQIINNCVPLARKEFIKEFNSVAKTLKMLNESDYFKDESSQQKWPNVLLNMLSASDALNLNCKTEYELAICSLGTVIEYMKKSLIEDELLSMKLFEEYIPNDLQDDKQGVEEFPKTMVLDSITLKNLEIFENSSGEKSGTLFEMFENCKTAFGKRLIRQWLCSPPCQIDLIKQRQEAVDEMCESLRSTILSSIVNRLKKIPDLERLLSKIHSQGHARKSKDHPDSRAILFDANVYNKRNINDFIATLEGFKESYAIIEMLQKESSNLKSTLLRKILNFQESGGCFPNLKAKLDYFDTAFDHRKAKEDGKIIPQKGVDKEYDDSQQQIKTIQDKLMKYKDEQKKFFNCSKIEYTGSGKNRYQLEVPEAVVKKVTKEYELTTSKKGFKRYWTPTIKKLLEELVSAEETKENALQDILRRIFAKFDHDYDVWSSAIQCLAMFDAILCLMFSRDQMIASGSDVCQPKFVTNEVPFIDLVNSRHPCLLKYRNDFIPNDFNNKSEVCLLTGPNMGGKSTLMRQVGLITVMAHVGAFVPAQSCTLTPVDRIFTRIGAFDRIIEGESTFFVELSETSIILKHATKHSLVLIDELGRGTATFDGTAIAYAVVNELSNNIKCRTLFSTHYFSLVDEFSKHQNIQTYHMACMIENENDDDPTKECITFLYKLKPGSCPKSYGFNAARLAEISDSIVKIGFAKAKEFEKKNEIRKTIRKLLCNDNIGQEDFDKTIASLKKFIIN